MADEIEGDSKDWTWVLHTRCPDCGFDAAVVDPTTVAGRVREMLPTWRAVLARPTAGVRQRAGVWSDLEYGCHVRDVFRLFERRLVLMLNEDDPQFANWDQDATAIEDRYAEQDPATVAGELVDAGRALAEQFDAVAGDQWERPGRRSDGARFTVATFAIYLVHDPLHHLWDVGAV